MKLKSLKLALSVLDVCLKKHKHLIDCVKDDEDYNMGMEAYEDIEECIKAIDERVEEIKKADTTSLIATGWTFPTMIDVDNNE